ncbi:MFS transporter [Sphingobium sp. BS19]|uniref:MFS transporter n=1 Tax=Sphingobium sp. BS19 TaxID=3018973 RepID=UPI0022EFB499|nr:MFS transporter [Sphingobium sp. BS19]GLJ00276.1 MFS transporter [Sphingobium sp. BS19]
MLLSVSITIGGIAGFGIFLKPLLEYFGGGRAQITAIATVGLFASAGAALFTGWLLDRIDLKLVVLAGLLQTGLGYLIAAQADHYWMVLVAYVFLGSGASFAGLIPLTIIANNWFVEKKRAFAFSVGVVGVAAGPLGVNYLVTYCLEYLNWRWGYGILAAISFLVVVPLVVLFVQAAPLDKILSPNQSGGRPDLATTLPGLSLREALKGRAFWLLALIFAAYGVISTAVSFHLIALLTDRGFSLEGAATSFSAMLICAILGKPLFGALADRFGARLMLAAGLTLLALGLLGLSMGLPFFATVVSTSLFGFGAASVPVLVPMLQVEAFGGRRLGSLTSYIHTTQLVAGAIGGPLAGAVFDAYGSYLPIYLPLIGCAALCVSAPIGLTRFTELADKHQDADPIPAI